MSSAVAFLAGMGAGYLGGKDKELERKRREARDKREQDAFDMQKSTFDQNQADKDAVRTAGAPQEVTAEQGPPTEAQYAATPAGQEPDAIGYRVGNGIGAKDFATRGLAEAAATEQNTTQARRTRMADLALRGNTYAASALDVDRKQVKQGREDTGWTQEQTAYVKKLKDEGVFDAAKALRVGDAAGMAEAFNRSGEHKIIGDVTMTPEIRDIPGIGKVQTNTATFQMQMPDGTVQPMKRNSHDLSMTLMPYEKQLKTLIDGGKEASEAGERTAKTNYYNAAADSVRPGGTKDKRGTAVDRMSEYDKTTLLNINKQRDTIHGAIVKAQAEENYDPTKPGARELTEQLAALGIKEAQIQSKYGDAQATPDPQGLRKPAPAASESKLRAQAAGNMGADPKAIQREIDAATADLKKVTDPGSKEQLQTHINDLKRQAGNLPADTQAAAIATRPAPTPREIAATRGSSPVTGAPTLAPSAPALAARGVQAPAPSYDQWMAAKNVKDQLINNANQMSPENRDLYLQSRLPQIEQAIAFNQNYKKY